MLKAIIITQIPITRTNARLTLLLVLRVKKYMIHIKKTETIPNPEVEDTINALTMKACVIFAFTVFCTPNSFMHKNGSVY